MEHPASSSYFDANSGVTKVLICEQNISKRNGGIIHSKKYQGMEIHVGLWTSTYFKKLQQYFLLFKHWSSVPSEPEDGSSPETWFKRQQMWCLRGSSLFRHTEPFSSYFQSPSNASNIEAIWSFSLPPKALQAWSFHIITSKIEHNQTDLGQRLSYLCRYPPWKATIVWIGAVSSWSTPQLNCIPQPAHWYGTLQFSPRFRRCQKGSSILGAAGAIWCQLSTRHVPARNDFFERRHFSGSGINMSKCWDQNDNM